MKGPPFSFVLAQRTQCRLILLIILPTKPHDVWRSISDDHYARHKLTLWFVCMGHFLCMFIASTNYIPSCDILLPWFCVWLHRASFPLVYSLSLEEPKIGLVLLLWIFFVICISCLFCHAVLYDPCILVITCWEREDLLDLLCVMFFFHFHIWCPGPGVVLDCNDSWSLPSSLLWCRGYVLGIKIWDLSFVRLRSALA